MNIQERYEKNLGTFTLEEVEKIRRKKICIIGCGGLGGYCANALARFGVGKITLVDGDVFKESNLNRQLFSNYQLIDSKTNKAEAVAENLREINSEINIVAIPEMINEQNGEKILKDHDLVIDCLDNVPSRMLLSKLCTKENLVMVHGAISKWYGQVANIFPNDNLIKKIYSEKTLNGERSEIDFSVPSFIPQIISSVQVSEALKYLSGKKEILEGELLLVDLLYNEFNIIKL
ncbi:HesA/MoeB/ThiF family protein [Miniphocaeibacter halophilus]|uniref:HesA/MoeB/ThiF family protein n=1 Tax=Miniphocaeibacter halophilus TaxID=2931922 RepID=A0AC61MM22_9FIRM|nr:HesA/MoeB/ThiF family protein [Miniphocaeibacter halophilus]QQK06867.1 HesA/MoeB/ThiF family protein [Miniphocaeibacter halophilus]